MEKKYSVIMEGDGHRAEVGEGSLLTCVVVVDSLIKSLNHKGEINSHTEFIFMGTILFTVNFNDGAVYTFTISE